MTPAFLSLPKLSVPGHPPTAPPFHAHALLFPSGHVPGKARDASGRLRHPSSHRYPDLGLVVVSRDGSRLIGCELPRPQRTVDLQLMLPVPPGAPGAQFLACVFSLSSRNQVRLWLCLFLVLLAFC